jgi:cyclohexadienyl dehydratase
LLFCPTITSAAEALRVGTSGDYAPFSLAQSDGTLRGFDIEVAHQLGAEWGMRVELGRFKWPELDADLRKGAFDIFMSGVTMRPERAIEGRYTRPYARTGAVAMIRKADESRFRSIAALNVPDRRIVVNAGGHLERIARRFFSRASIQTVSDNLSLAALVRSDQADAAISDSAEAPGVLNDDLLAIGPFTSDYKAFLLPAVNAELALRVDEWLVRRENDGSLGKLRRQWLTDSDPADQRNAAYQAVVAAIGLRLGVMPFVAAAKQAAGRPIEDTDQEARVLARVRAQSRSAPDRVENVYRLLIEIAKGVQRTVEPAAQAIPLLSLRGAIERIDEQLVRELDRLPASQDSDWEPLLAAQLSPLSVDTDLQNQLAAALSSGPASP